MGAQLCLGHCDAGRKTFAHITLRKQNFKVFQLSEHHVNFPMSNLQVQLGAEVKHSLPQNLWAWCCPHSAG